MKLLENILESLFKPRELNLNILFLEIHLRFFWAIIIKFLLMLTLSITAGLLLGHVIYG